MTVAPASSGAAVEPAPVAGKIGPPRSGLSTAIEAWAESMRARGKRATSIRRFTDKARECAAFNGWATAADVTYTGAVSWLAAKRAGGWGPATYSQTVSALRRFGRFLHVSRECADNPFAALEGTGEQGGEGSRALTTEEARAMIAAAYAVYVKKDAESQVRAMAALPYLFPPEQGGDGHGKNDSSPCVSAPMGYGVSSQTETRMTPCPTQLNEPGLMGGPENVLRLAIEGVPEGLPTSPASEVEHGPTHCEAGNKGVPNRAAPGRLAHLDALAAAHLRLVDAHAELVRLAGRGAGA